MHRLLTTLALAGSTLVAVAAPAGAQQLVDAGKDGQGGAAFIGLTILCCVIVGALFYMDRVRRKRADDPQD